MAKAKVQDLEVVRVGMALRDAGLSVNGWALRRELGGGKSERLIKVWRSSPEGRRQVEQAAKGRIDPKAVQTALDTIWNAATSALNELDRVVSERMEVQDQRHAEELLGATRWAEGFEEMVDQQVTAASERADRAEAEVSGVRQELSDLRTLAQAAQAAESALRGEVDAVRAELAHATAARDEAVARATGSEDRARAALERAARAEGALEALKPKPRGRPPKSGAVATDIS